MKKNYLSNLVLLIVLFPLLHYGTLLSQTVHLVPPYGEFTDIEPDAFIYSKPAGNAIHYEFHVQQAENGIDRIIVKDVNYFNLNELGNENIHYNTIYVIKSRTVTASATSRWGNEVRVATPAKRGYRYGHVRLQFRQGDQFKYMSFRSSEGVVNNSDIPDFNRLAEAALIKDYAYPLKKLMELTGKDPYSCVDLVFSDKFSVDSIINFFESQDYIEFAEPHYTYELTSVPDEYDPLRDSNGDGIPDFWHLTDIDAPAAWSITGSTAQVIIAVIDNVFDIDHPELRKNIYINTGEIPDGTVEDFNGNGVVDADDLYVYYSTRGYSSLKQLFTNPPYDAIFNGIDDDGNGYIDDICGWSVPGNNNNVTPAHNNGDFHSHGTHVAGIAGAVSGNGSGICALSNNNVRILPIKLSSDSEAYTGNNLYGLISAFEYILNLDQKPHVISMSLVGNYSHYIQDALEIVETRFGVLCVAATGNDGSNGLEKYPAWHEKVIAVGATNSSNTISFFSNYGNIPGCYVMAPGEDIYSTVVNRRYGLKSGTSMACPLVSSLAGLLYSYNPNATPEIIRRAIECGCANNPSQMTGYNSMYHGSGKINAYRSLLCLMDMAPVAHIVKHDSSYCPGNYYYAFTGTSLTSTEDCSYNWVVSGGSYSIVGSTTEEQLRVIFSDTAIYTLTLTITNPNGSHIYTTEIDVKLPSVEILNSEITETCIGNNTNIYLEFEGSPPFTLNYTFNGITGNFTTNNYRYILHLTTDNFAGGSSHIFRTGLFTDAHCHDQLVKQTIINISDCIVPCNGKYNQVIHYNYYGPDGEGIIFDPGSRIVENPFQPGRMSFEGAASISDADGKPVLSASGGYIYSTGESCNGVIINNTPVTLYNNISATQGHLILPNLSDHNKYYVLTVSHAGAWQQFLGWGIVDFSGSECGTYTHGGYFTENGESEKLTACRIEGENGYWILTHMESSNTFNIYKLSEQNNTLIYYGSQNISSRITFPNIGEMKFNLSMDHLAVIFNDYNTVELYKFNRDINHMGDRLELVGVKNLNNYESHSRAYAVEFSPSGRYLYATTAIKVLQIDLENFSTLDPVVIYESGANLFGLTLGPDMKIYIGHGNYIHIIDNPDAPASSLNFIESAFTGLHLSVNFPQRIPVPGESLRLEKVVSGCSNIIRANTDSPGLFEWNDGNVGSEIEISIPGTYSVTVTFSNGCTTSESITVTEGQIYHAPEITNTEVTHSCDGQADGQISVSVSGGMEPIEYRWENSNGNYLGNTPVLTGLGTGLYTLYVTDNYGCTVTHRQTIVPASSPVIGVELISHACNNNPGSAEVVYEGYGDYQYLWSNGETTRIAVNLPPGLNYVKVISAEGCYAKDSVEIMFLNPDANFKSSKNCYVTVDPLLYFYPAAIDESDWHHYSFVWESNGRRVSTEPRYYPMFDYDGYYCLKLTVSTGDCSASSNENLFVYPSDCYCEYPGALADVIINDNTEWTTEEVWINGTLRVKPRSTLILKGCTLHFGPKGRVVIEPRGRIISDGSVFTSFEDGECNHMWQGIEVHGNPMMVSVNPFQGSLELMAGSEIRNAHIGVLLSSRDMDYICYRYDPEVRDSFYWGWSLGVFPENYSGGIIVSTLKNSRENKFINNGIHIKGVNMKYARNNSSGIKLENTIFRSDGLLDARYDSNHPHWFGSTNHEQPWAPQAGDGIRSFACIEMEGRNGFSIEKCSFEKAYYCIRTIDSKYNVYGSSFYDAHFGIFIYNTLTTIDNSHEISECSFDMIPGFNPIPIGQPVGVPRSTYAHIHIYGGKYDYIHDNRFGNELSQQNKSDYGINLISCSGFNIVENDFWRLYTGISVSNSGETGGFIGAGLADSHENWRGNMFTDTRTNIYTSSNNPKLTLKCNICNNESDPLYYVNFDSYGTLANQGAGGSISGPLSSKSAAGNEFQGFANNPKKIISRNNSYNYYHHSSPESTVPDVSFSRIPIYLYRNRFAKGSNSYACSPVGYIDYQSPQVPALPGQIESQSVNTLFYDNDLSMIEKITEEIELIESEFRQVKDRINNTEKSDILDKVSMIRSSSVIKQQLIHNSPLPDTVLINIIINYPLSDMDFYEIMRENMPVSMIVEPYLRARMETRPVISDIVLDLQAFNPYNETSYYNIKNELDYLRINRQNLLNIYLYNIIEEGNNEIAIEMLNNENTVSDKQTLTATYISESNIEKAISNNYNLELLSREETDLAEYHNFLIYLKENNRSFYDMDSTELDFIRKIAVTCPAGIASANARSILEYYFNERLPLCEEVMIEKNEIILPDPLFELYEMEAYISDNYPEPFNNETSFEYYIPEGSEGAIFINDIFGRKISEFPVTEGTHTLTVNTSDWNSGIYIYGLIVDDRIISYRKMVLTR